MKRIFKAAVMATFVVFLASNSCYCLDTSSSENEIDYEIKYWDSRGQDGLEYLTASHDNSDNVVATNSERMSIVNMTCQFFTQPLNHFVPRGKSPTYQQRYCVYDDYAYTESGTPRETKRNRPSNGKVSDKIINKTAPILFYTGNESPLEQYINQTGIMWELAPQLGARVVFVEHRYEGLSLPTNVTHDCLSYCSTMQALADYARILEVQLNPHQAAPVIAFGGSYGGMLSGWFRMKYPHLVEGAIAASAPIGAFPQIANNKIDGSARVLMHGLQQSFPPTTKTTTTRSSSSSSLSPISVSASTEKQGKKRNEELDTERMLSDQVATDNQDQKSTNHCPTNLLAAWPLIQWLARQQDQRNDVRAKQIIQSSFSLCEPLPDNGKAEDAAMSLIAWAQAVWFDLAESSFPFPSSYLPFALLHKKVKLPAWPLQAACWNHSQLHADFGVRFNHSTYRGVPSLSLSPALGLFGGQGDLISDLPTQRNVSYDIFYGDSNLALHVEWDKVTSISSLSDPHVDLTSSSIVNLLSNVRDAVSIWYNITADVKCYNISEPAPNRHQPHSDRKRQSYSKRVHGSMSFYPQQRRVLQMNQFQSRDDVVSNTCYDEMKRVGSWEPLCCNDEMNLVITLGHGLGRDFFWPPSHPQTIKTYTDVIRNITPVPCPDPDGIFGYSKEPYELMSTRLDTYYGGINMDSHSNIVFSNGLLDPWSAGGVFADDPWDRESMMILNDDDDRATVQNVTSDGSVIALIIPFGGHHTDLMYSDHRYDPNCVREARQIETKYIKTWIDDWYGRLQKTRL